MEAEPSGILPAVSAVLSSLALERNRSYRGSSVELVSTVETKYPLGDAIMVRCTGKKVNGNLEGYGTAEFNDGHTYQGEFHAGVMHGQGKYTWTDGAVYKGQFTDCHITGEGTYTWVDGSSYEGQVVDGLRHGQGTFYCPPTHSSSRRSSYTGQWVRGQRHGKGRLVYEGAEESYYDGDWVQGQKQGRGTRKYRSGNVYEGEWSNNERHGQGTMHWYDLGERYSGSWVEGVQNGQGEHIWFLRKSDSAQYPLCNRYVGEWRNGMRDGTGTFYYASGAVYTGEWKANKKHGRGRFTLQNGEVFERSFEQDRMVGGSLTSAAEQGLARPTTPLGNLIGDIDTTELLGSVTEKFNLHISALIPPSADTKHELKQVHCVILRHITELKRIYHCYSCLGKGDQNRQPLSRMQFWRLLKDCQLHRCGLTLCAAEAYTSTCPTPHSPTETLLMREFLQALVFIAHVIYWDSSEAESGGSGRLAWCLSNFIKSSLLPFSCKVQGPLFSSLEHHDLAEPYQQTCWTMYQCLTSQQLGKEKCLKLRQILLLLKACGVLEGHLCAGEVVGILAQENPLAVDDGDYNLEVMVTFLEFFEALLLCAEKWYANFINSQPAITTTQEDPVLNQSSPHPSSPVGTTTPEGPAPCQSSPQASISVQSSPDPGQVDDTGDGGTEGDSEKVASTHLILCTEAEQQEQGGEMGQRREALRMFFTVHLFPHARTLLCFD